MGGNMGILGLLMCFIAVNAVAVEPGERVEFTNLQAFNTNDNSNWGPVLKDIMNHEAPGDSDQYDDRITLGHETTHGINAYIRNHLNQTGKNANGFYVLQNRAVVVVEPNIKKSSVANYVPPSLRGWSYDTYIVGQTEWDDTPLYLFDEWDAYVNGGATGVDLVQHQLWNDPWRDGVRGPLEFTVYALATAMAVKELDSNYFETNQQFKEFLAFNVKRAMQVYLTGSVMTAFKWDEQDRSATS